VALQDAGLTNRDVAHLLGVTEPRVTQLAPRDGRRSVPSPVPSTT
jgi:predicted XRE-type DNA-binding protein